MNISIMKGTFEHLKDCAYILEDSILGQKYFTDRDDQYIGESLLKLNQFSVSRLHPA